MPPPSLGRGQLPHYVLNYYDIVKFVFGNAAARDARAGSSLLRNERGVIA